VTDGLAERVANYSRLLQHLVQLGLVAESDARVAVEREKERGGGDLLDAVLGQGLVHEQELAGALASFYRIPQVNLTRVRVTKQALREATGEFCRQHQVLPFAVDHQTSELLVAVADPAQVAAVDALRFRRGQSVRTYVAQRSQLREAIEFYYFTEHTDSRPLTGPPRSGLTQRPQTSPRVSSAVTRRPTTGSRVASGDAPSGSLGDFRRAVSVEHYAPPDEALLVRGYGPGTEDLGSPSPLPAEPSGHLFDRERSGESSGSAFLAELRAESGGSGLGTLNPFSSGEATGPGSDPATRAERLTATVERLEKALRFEMSVSQALAEVLVENGLISAEQLKSRLRKT
jgi:hypothetical protein